VRRISVKDIADKIEHLYGGACYQLGDDVRQALESALASERDSLGKAILTDIIKNIDCALEDHVPICQDTGMAVVFIRLGQEVALIDGDINEAVNEGVRRACANEYLRASVLSPLDRVNTKDNTPAILHIEIVPGDRVQIDVAPKGFGSENMSRMGLMTPSGGKQAVEDFIVETVRIAGGNPCPPVIVGVGIGGTIEKAAYMAKHVLLRPLNSTNEDAALADMEDSLLKQINALGIGPQGLGGDTTALRVMIESFPTHIAGLPVVVNMQCHAARHASARI
jgi:fumarate hydratase subunit alpha